jgi:hypothetical protein
VNAKCREETAQDRGARDQEQEEACAVAIWARAAAQEQEEVRELAVVAWAGWAERAPEQDPAGSASVHRAALQRHIRSVLLATRCGVHAVELRWRESKVEKSERIAALSIFVNVILIVSNPFLSMERGKGIMM